VLFTCLIVIPIGLLNQSDGRTLYLLAIFSVYWITVATILIIFGPKVATIYKDASGLIAQRISDSRATASGDSSGRNQPRTLKEYAAQPVRLMDRITVRSYVTLLERELAVARKALATLDANENVLAPAGQGGHGGHASVVGGGGDRHSNLSVIGSGRDGMNDRGPISMTMMQSTGSASGAAFLNPAMVDRSLRGNGGVARTTELSPTIMSTPKLIAAPTAAQNINAVPHHTLPTATSNSPHAATSSARLPFFAHPSVKYVAATSSSAVTPPNTAPVGNGNGVRGSGNPRSAQVSPAPNMPTTIPTTNNSNAPLLSPAASQRSPTRMLTPTIAMTQLPSGPSQGAVGSGGGTGGAGGTVTTMNTTSTVDRDSPSANSAPINVPTSL
jgi:hypothetical protein